MLIVDHHISHYRALAQMGVQVGFGETAARAFTDGLNEKLNTAPTSVSLECLVSGLIR